MLINYKSSTGSNTINNGIQEYRATIFDLGEKIIRAYKTEFEDIANQNPTPETVQGQIWQFEGSYLPDDLKYIYIIIDFLKVFIDINIRISNITSYIFSSDRFSNKIKNSVFKIQKQIYLLDYNLIKGHI
jgi:hypothetical protein